jgi:hypothetical protein
MEMMARQRPGAGLFGEGRAGFAAPKGWIIQSESAILLA